MGGTRAEHQRARCRRRWTSRRSCAGCDCQLDKSHIMWRMSPRVGYVAHLVEEECQLGRASNPPLCTCLTCHLAFPLLRLSHSPAADRVSGNHGHNGLRASSHLDLRVGVEPPVSQVRIFGSLLSIMGLFHRALLVQHLSASSNPYCSRPPTRINTWKSRMERRGTASPDRPSS